MLDNKTKRNSRHIYDLSQLLTRVVLDNNIKNLIIEVRKDRKSGTKCYFARDGVSVSLLLQQIIDTNYFKDDYENVSYDEAIKSLKTIIGSGIFEL